VIDLEGDCMRRELILGTVGLSAACLLLACGPKKPPTPAAQADPAGSRGLVADPTAMTAPTSPGDLAAFWAPWFAGPYEYMFTAVQGPGWEGSPALARQRGEVFGAGISGFYFYGGMDDCLRAHLGDEVRYDHDEYASLATMAGRPFKIDQVGEGWDRSFGKYDPAVIDWAAKALIPEPGDRLAWGTAQQVYDSMFFRVVRLHARAYIELRTKYDLANESQGYLTAMEKAPDFYGPEWLEQRYAGALASYYPLYADGTMLSAPQVLGFWLRRHMDGTEATILARLGDILRAYDPTFVNGHAAYMGYFGGI
jgi:hypothetical protein